MTAREKKTLDKISLKREFAEGIKLEDGKTILLLKRKKSNRDTEICPFCGGSHYHGKGDGHRVAHCPSIKNPLINKVHVEYIFDRHAIFRNRLGEIFDAEDGYFIQTIED